MVSGHPSADGGAVWIDSEPGQGAKFTIYLPRVEECPATPEAVHAPCPDPRNARGLAGRPEQA
jgi:hypothetical protein